MWASLSKDSTGIVMFTLSLVLFVVIITLMVIVQLAERRIPIQYAGKGRFSGEKSTGAYRKTGAKDEGLNRVLQQECKGRFFSK